MRSNHAFTVIELLIACIIIAVLVSMALPFYATYTERARGSRALETLHIIRTAQMLYLTDVSEYCTDSGVLQNYINFEDNDGDWVYTLENVGDDTFRAVATRTSPNPAYNNLRITLDQTSDIVFPGGGDSYPP